MRLAIPFPAATVVELRDNDGSIGFMPRWCACCRADLDLTDGQTIDGRTKVVAIYNYDDRGDYSLAHKDC